MPSIAEIKTNAEQLRQADKFAEALPLYKQLWEQHRESCNEWEGWGYAICLKHLKNYKEALGVCREVYKLKPNFEQNRGVYAWCIYYTEIAIEKINSDKTLFKAGEAIIKLTKQENKSIEKENDFPCVYTISLFRIIDYLNKKANKPFKIILDWTEKLDPGLLATTPFKLDGKEHASPKEKWYSIRSEALYESKRYEDCISLSETALKSFKRFHYDNNIWFERNIARSKAELGELEIAITKLKSLLERKNEWYIQKEIAELLKRQGKIDESLAFAIDAALNRGEPDFKINLYTLLSELLKEKAKINEAKTHVELIYQIKVAKQWRIDDDFNKLVLDYKIETRNLPSSKELLWKLKQIWESMKYDNQELLKGKIKNIISDGKAGFICADNRREYFFFANAFNGKKELLHQGQRVSFYLEDSYDKKKNQPSKIAVYIKPIM